MSGIEIHVWLDCDVVLQVEEVWPDGNAPAEPTAADVIAVMRSHGMRHVPKDWGLLDDTFVGVSVVRPNPAYRGPDALPGFEAPEPTIRTRERVHL